MTPKLGVCETGSSSVATEINEIVSADHCTIFGKIRIGTKEILAVAASTSTKIYQKSTAEMYYRLGEPFDGLTGRVGTTGIPISSANLSDAAQKEWHDIGAEWKRGMSEEGQQDPEIAAFYCLPIQRAPGGEVIGVLRLHRAKTQGQQGDFGPRVKERVEFLCDMLGHAYGKRGFLSAEFSFGDGAEESRATNDVR